MVSTNAPVWQPYYLSQSSEASLIKPLDTIRQCAKDFRSPELKLKHKRV